MRECDVCDDIIYEGYLDEVTSHVFCSEECAKLVFADFENRNKELEIFWTTFE